MQKSMKGPPYNRLDKGESVVECVSDDEDLEVVGTAETNPVCLDSKSGEGGADSAKKKKAEPRGPREIAKALKGRTAGITARNLLKKAAEVHCPVPDPYSNAEITVVGNWARSMCNAWVRFKRQNSRLTPFRWLKK